MGNILRCCLGNRLYILYINLQLLAIAIIFQKVQWSRERVLTQIFNLSQLATRFLVQHKCLCMVFMMTMLKLFESKTTTSLTTGSPKLLMLSQKVVKYLVSTLHHHLPYIISGDKDGSGGFRAARLPRQVTRAVHVVSLWVQWRKIQSLSLTVEL